MQFPCCRDGKLNLSVGMAERIAFATGALATYHTRGSKGSTGSLRTKDTRRADALWKSMTLLMPTPRCSAGKWRSCRSARTPLRGLQPSTSFRGLPTIPESTPAWRSVPTLWSRARQPAPRRRRLRRGTAAKRLHSLTANHRFSQGATAAPGLPSMWQRRRGELRSARRWDRDWARPRHRKSGRHGKPG